MAREVCFAKELEENYNRQRTNWQSVIDKYNRPYPGSDEIHFKSMSVKQNSGQLDHMKPRIFGKSRLAVKQVKDCTYLLGPDETLDLGDQSKIWPVVERNHSDNFELSNTESLSTYKESDSDALSQEIFASQSDEEWEDDLSSHSATEDLLSTSMSSDESSGYCERFYSIKTPRKSGNDSTIRTAPRKSWKTSRSPDKPIKVSEASEIVKLESSKQHATDTSYLKNTENGDHDIFAGSNSDSTFIDETDELEQPNTDSIYTDIPIPSSADSLPTCSPTTKDNSSKTPSRKVADATFTVVSSKKPSRKIIPVMLSSCTGQGNLPDTDCRLTDVSSHEINSDESVRDECHAEKVCQVSDVVKRLGGKGTRKLLKKHSDNEPSSGEKTCTQKCPSAKPSSRSTSPKKHQKGISTPVKTSVQQSAVSTNKQNKSSCHTPKAICKQSTTIARQNEAAVSSPSHKRTPKSQSLRIPRTNLSCYTEEQICEYLSSPQCKTLPGLPSVKEDTFTPTKASPGTSFTSRQIQDAMNKLRIMSAKKNSAESNTQESTKPTVSSRKKLSLTPERSKENSTVKTGQGVRRHGSKRSALVSSELDSASDFEPNDNQSIQSGSLGDVDTDQEESLSETVLDTTITTMTKTKSEPSRSTPKRNSKQQTLVKNRTTSSPSMMLARLNLKASQKVPPTSVSKTLPRKTLPTSPAPTSKQNQMSGRTTVNSPASTSTPNKHSKTRCFDIVNISMIAPLSKQNHSSKPVEHSQKGSCRRFSLQSTVPKAKKSSPISKKQSSPKMVERNLKKGRPTVDVDTGELSPDVYAFSSSDSDKMYDFSDKSLLRESKQEIFNMSTPSGRIKPKLKKANNERTPSAKTKLEFSDSISSMGSHKRKRNHILSTESEGDNDSSRKRRYRHNSGVTSDKTVTVKDDEDTYHSSSDDTHQKFAQTKIKTEQTSFSESVTCPGPDQCTKSFCFSCNN